MRQGRGDWLVVLDGDGQNDPADIPAMLEEAKRRFAADKSQVGLIGHRVTRRDDWVKRLSSRLANGFRDLLLRDASLVVVRATDLMGGLAAAAGIGDTAAP